MRWECRFRLAEPRRDPLKNELHWQQIGQTRKGRKEGLARIGARPAGARAGPNLAAVNHPAVNKVVLVHVHPLLAPRAYHAVSRKVEHRRSTRRPSVPRSLWPIPGSLPKTPTARTHLASGPLPVNCWDWTKAIALPRLASKINALWPLARRLIFLRWGLPGSGARCPRPQSPHVRNYSNNHSALSGSTSFPV